MSIMVCPKLLIRITQQVKCWALLRVFSTLKKNCYTITNLNEGERVLVRASFFYGNYDGKNSPPTFDLLFDGNHWETMKLSNYTEDTIVYTEAVYDVIGNSTTVFVAQTLPNQLPFISALELRSLGSNMYRHGGSNTVLVLANRAFQSQGANQNIRYSMGNFILNHFYSL